MKNSIVPIVIILTLAMVGLSGCIHGEGTGVLLLQITDAPSDLNITKALVNISNIEVHLIATGWCTVVEESQLFDLIELKDVKKILGSVTLSTGRYTQIRLHIDNALVTIDGIEHNLKIPSNTVQLISPFSINENETTTLTIDFDVQDSVFPTGSGKYMMKPTIKIIQE
ncbi:MAG: DUF4382 domain-containing protein [Thermoplasmatales archaeon]|nr:MAG: DUF4382 domain-containing protein [Thermoplasmatales archaeon]